MNLFIIIIIAVSLSMDAFSMALAYGTLSIPKNEIIIISTVVGIYHFFMPILGSILGNALIEKLPITSNFIVFIVLIFIGIEMIISTIKQEEDVKRMSFFKVLLFGFTVSIDSFSLGVGLSDITSNIFIASFIFSITSFIFTLTGMMIGKKINQIFGAISTLVGGFILILIAILYIF